MRRTPAPSRPNTDLFSADAAREVSHEDVDPRLVDLAPDEESPFLRAQRRVSVRRGALPCRAADRIRHALVALLFVGFGGGAIAFAYNAALASPRFRLASSENIQISGIRQVTRKQIMQIMSADFGRNSLAISLNDRRRRLEEIPWIELATISRLLPSSIQIAIRERTPVAFVHIGSRIAFMDTHGAVMDLPAGTAGKYSFPVVVGVSPNEPLAVRAARMKVFTTLISELDSGGQRYSQDLSEVDLADPEDVKAMVADPGGTVLVHFGSSDFLERYRIYVSHVQEWRQQFANLESVDLRYDGQVIVNPDARTLAQPPSVKRPQSAPPRPMEESERRFARQRR
jgi:cell division protein FtsQ